MSYSGLFFFILWLFSWKAVAAPDALDHLRELVERPQESRTLEEWHESKEALETEGLHIWEEHARARQFCNGLRTWSNKHLAEISHWELEYACGAELANSVDAYIDQVLSVPVQAQELRPCKDQPGGDSKRVLVDTAGGPRLVTGGLERCEIALSFDDGPHPRLTSELLEILKNEGVKANFFLVGRNVNRFPEIVRNIERDGHSVGNHSQTHKNLPRLPENLALNEILDGFTSLQIALEYVEPFFRYPYGAFTKFTRNYLQTNNIAEFFWNMDTRDWDIKSPQKLLSRVIGEINREQRGIMLFHDVHPQTIAIMPHLLQELKKAGYTLAYFKPSP